MRLAPLGVTAARQGLTEGLVQDTVVLENGAAYIKGQRFPLDTHELIEVAGKGANGVVFKAKHRFLNRVEAVKLWLPRAGDKRDKIKQGIYETQNQAATIHSEVIKILHADIINGDLLRHNGLFQWW